MRPFFLNTLRLFSGFFVFAILLTGLGCGGPGTGTVTGKVTYKGSPLKGGRVIFASGAGPSLGSSISEDGSYTVQRVPVGDVKIAVQTKELGVIAGASKGMSGPPKGQGGPPKGITGPMPGKMTPEDAARRFVAIPAHYEDADKSTLTYTVKKGAQEHNITLDGSLTPGTPKK